MAENAGLENHRIKSFKNKGRDVEWLGDTSLLRSLLSYDCPRLRKRLFRKAT